MSSCTGPPTIAMFEGGPSSESPCESELERYDRLRNKALKYTSSDWAVATQVTNSHMYNEEPNYLHVIRGVLGKDLRKVNISKGRLVMEANI